MRHWFFVAIFLMGLPASSHGDEIETLKACLAGKLAGIKAEADPTLAQLEQCVGVIKQPCLEQSTTDGQSDAQKDAISARCVAEEQQAWLLIQSEAMEALSIFALTGELTDGDPALGGYIFDDWKQAQRAWEAFRKAECNRNWLGYLGRGGTAEIEGDCIIRLTARRALELNLKASAIASGTHYKR